LTYIRWSDGNLHLLKHLLEFKLISVSCYQFHVN